MTRRPLSLLCVLLSLAGALLMLSASQPVHLPGVGAQAATPGCGGPDAAVGNPAAVYCQSLGYTYRVVRGADGAQSGECVLPDRKACGEWDFYAGTCGAGYSYCARQGYRTQTRSDGQDPYAQRYAVCSDARGRVLGSVWQLAGLTLRGAEPGGPFQTPWYQAQAGPVFIPPARTADLPAEIDWRNYLGGNWLSPVKDQGGCGGCWAFAALGVTEFYRNWVSSNPNLDLDLAEQDLVSCSGAGTCNGGNPVPAWNYEAGTGVVDEGCFGYQAADVPCSKCADWESRVTRVDQYSGFTPSHDLIQQAVVNYGPTYVAMGIGAEFGGYFDGGGIYRCANDSGSNHAVVVVGYNDAGGYWIVRNSWGSWWNGDGYFKLGYGECAAETTHAGYLLYLPPEQRVRVVNTWTGDGSWNLKTSFNPGDPIQYAITVENQTGAAASIQLTWDVRGPDGQSVFYWSGTLDVGPGTATWGFPRTVPSGMGGTHTFTGTGLYQGYSSQAVSTYFVSGPGATPTSTPTATPTQTVTATLTQTPTQTATQTATLTPSPTATLPAGQQVRVIGAWTGDGSWNPKTSFNPGDAIQYNLVIENLTGADASIYTTFLAQGPSGEVLLSWEGWLTTGPGAINWGFARTVPTGMGGTHTFTGTGLYQGVSSQASTTYFVSGPTATLPVTPSPTATATWTPTPSPTATATWTPTPSPTATLPAGQQVRVIGVWTGDENWIPKTSFNPGDSILYAVMVENQTSATVSIQITWDVRGPSGESIIYWSGMLDVNPGTANWGITSTVPGGMGGTHTFNGTGLYQGVTSQASSTYFVSGPTATPIPSPTVTVIPSPTVTFTPIPSPSVTVTPSPTPTLPADQQVHLEEAQTLDDGGNPQTTFNPGENITYRLLVNNQTGSPLNVDLTWDVRGPHGESIFYWSGLVSLYTGMSFPSFTQNVPVNNGGTYTFNASALYSGAASQASVTFFVSGPAARGAYLPVIIR